MNVMPSKRYGEASDRKSIGRVERLPRLYTSARPASSPASDRRRAVAGRPDLTLISKTGMKGDVDVKRLNHRVCVRFFGLRLIRPWTTKVTQVRASQRLRTAIVRLCHETLLTRLSNMNSDGHERYSSLVIPTPDPTWAEYL
jgi:hypothetical protein